MIKNIPSIDPSSGMSCLVLFGRRVITFRRIVTPPFSIQEERMSQYALSTHWDTCNSIQVVINWKADKCTIQRSDNF